ncbi:hypothetical protein ES705_22367 [subsurface metagenome]
MPIRLVVLPGDALEADVKAGKTFFGNNKAVKKTGTMPTKAIVAAAETYEEGYHAGNPGGLSAIETDLAPANIKKDMNIFGKVGTFEGPAIASTLQGSCLSAGNTVNNTWETMCTASIEASAKRVILCFSHGITYSGPLYEMFYRGFYNGVQCYSGSFEVTKGYRLGQAHVAGAGIIADAYCETKVDVYPVSHTTGAIYSAESS